MPYIIRTVRPDDYGALAEVATAAYQGDPHDAAEMQEEDAPTPPLKSERWVAEVDGQVVGSASYFQSEARYHSQKFWMDAFVAPDFQGRGIGTGLFDYVMAAIAPEAPISLRTFTRDDIPQAVAFFGQRGFVEGKRTWRSFLDLSELDLARFARPEPPGIEIRTLAELQAGEGWEASLLELYNLIQTDIPDIDPATAVPMEQFRQTQLQSPRLLPGFYYIARDGGRWIGMTSLWKAVQPDEAATGVTGVLREYRGRDIAWALKLRSLADAQRHGFRRVETMNASTNRPMLAINEVLGFAKEPAWIHLIRTF